MSKKFHDMRSPWKMLTHGSANGFGPFQRQRPKKKAVYLVPSTPEKTQRPPASVETMQP